MYETNNYGYDLDTLKFGNQENFQLNGISKTDTITVYLSMSSMTNYSRIEKLSQCLLVAVNSHSSDKEKMAYLFEDLDNVFKEDFGDRLDTYESVHAYFIMFRASIRFLVQNNFIYLAYTHFEEIENRFQGFINDKKYTYSEKKSIEQIFKDIPTLTEDDVKRKNTIVPRLDCRCTLCRRLPANKTGSHMVPNFLAHPTFSYDGNSSRSRETLDFFSINEPESNTSFYGSAVSPKRIEMALGHPMSEEEIKENINKLIYDNEFCSVCEDRFGILETEYSRFYRGDKKSISSRLSYLFWLSVVWRMSMGSMGVFLRIEDEFELRRLLDNYIKESAKDIIEDDSDLGYWHYAIFQCKELKDGDKMIYGSRAEYSPYVTVMNDLIVVFFPHEPTDEELASFLIPLTRGDLNNWQNPEKKSFITRRQFWDVRDWLVDMSFNLYDPVRESTLITIREEERRSGKIIDAEDKNILIKAKRLVTGPRENRTRIRKLYRFFISTRRAKEARERGEEYDPFKDEVVFLCEKDFQNYYEDLVRAAGGGMDVSLYPYYNEARNTLPHEPFETEKKEKVVDKEYKDSLEWFENELRNENQVEEND